MLVYKVVFWVLASVIFVGLVYRSCKNISECLSELSED